MSINPLGCSPVMLAFQPERHGCIQGLNQNPQSKVFKDESSPCCEVVPRSQGGDGILCKKGGRVSADRNAHVFFDGLHPTEAVNVEIATQAFASYRAREVYPINVHQLAKL
ncbi:hypothetical protein SLE2022_333200 [Rubroshorea leprosula]